MPTIGDFRKQKRNANKHTERGLRLLSESIDRDGWIGALTVAADGETFDGSARLVTAQQDSQLEPIIVHTTGDKPVIVVRDDILTADDPKAKRLGVMANHVTATDWEPDAAILAEIARDDAVIAALANEEPKLLAVLNQGNIVTDPSQEWQGMPEFKNTEKAFKSIYVHFETEDAVRNFSELIEQEISEKTKYIWYPIKERQDLKSQEFVNES